MSPPPSASHRRQSSLRPEYAMRPCSPGAVPWPGLGRCDCPLPITVHVNRGPEFAERPALFIAARPDAHIEEDIERFSVRQPAVFVNVIDHIRVGALRILR